LRNWRQRTSSRERCRTSRVTDGPRASSLAEDRERGPAGQRFGRVPRDLGDRLTEAANLRLRVEEAQADPNRVPGRNGSGDRKGPPAQLVERVGRVPARDPKD